MARTSKFTGEQVKAALGRVDAGETIAAVAKDVGVSVSTINVWKKKSKKVVAEVPLPEVPAQKAKAVRRPKNGGTDLHAEIARLTKENAKLRDFVGRGFVEDLLAQA